jgi:hypothetical protein
MDISEKLVDHAKHVINIFRRPYLICKKMIKTSSIDEKNKNETENSIIPWDLFFFRRAFNSALSTSHEAQIKIYSSLFPNQTNKTLSHPALFFDLHDKTQPILISPAENYKTFVSENKILPIRSTIKSYKQNGIVLTDGTFVKCDAVIYCTGYKKNLNDFLELDQVKFDSLSLKNRISYSVYKLTFHPDITNLAFVGLSTGLLFTGIELQAMWTTMIFSGKIKLPSRCAMIKFIEKTEEETNPSHLNLFYPNGCHLTLCDNIAAEMDLLPNFDKLMLTDPISYDLLWNYGMCGPHYLFKKNKEYALSIMNRIKAFGTF